MLRANHIWVNTDRKMKAAMNKYQGNGDDQVNRLFFLLKKHFVEPEKFYRIKSQIYFVKFPGQPPAIIKQFFHYEKIKKQFILTDYLLDQGFPTYSFLKDYGIIADRESYYAFIQYIEPGRNKFTFKNRTDRSNGLYLLENLHRTSQTLIKPSMFPIFNQYNKWLSRLKEFQNNWPIFIKTAEFTILDRYLEMANWSLTSMEKYQNHYDAEIQTIIHGDVAHHNFLRNQENRLFLIDFDLAAISPAISDYLQYAHRILPLINWKVDSLFDLSPMKTYENHPWFLAGLAYPSDVFREANRIVRKVREGGKQDSLHHLQRIWQQYPYKESVFLQIQSKLAR